jgi:hypothetical protein
MTPLEGKVRDAIRAKAGEVPPSAVPPLRLPPRRQPPGRRRIFGRGRHWRGWAAPLAAAAAVAAVVAGTQIIVGSFHSRGAAPRVSGGAAVRFAVADSTGRSPLQVRAVATGTIVARVHLPTEPGSQAPAEPAHDGRTYVGGVATGNGRDYVVALFRPHPCRSWLYQFRLNSRGQPTPVTPLSARPTIAGTVLDELAVSGNGQELGYASASSGPACGNWETQPTHIGIMNLVTGRAKQWAIPTSNAVDRVSLNANGGLLLYSLQLRPSVVRIIPAGAPPGPAAGHSRTVLRAARFGRSRWASFAAIAPNGRTFCFSIYPPGGGGPGEIFVANLATGHTRALASGASYPGLIASDPGLHQLLLYMPHGLARLDLASGKVTYLPGWRGFIGRISW